jgi:hypothetical protein
MLQEECSNALYTSRGRPRALEHNREDIEYGNRGNRVQNLDSSFLSIDERGNIIPKNTGGSLGDSSSLPTNHTTSTKPPEKASG